jgi:putative membrane protein
VEPAFSYDMTYCGPPPDPADLMARWNFDPVLLVGLGLVAVFGWSMLRDADRLRRTAFIGAWSLAFILFVSPICALTVSLFSARVGHHVALTMLVAPMLAYALPMPKTERFGLAPALALSTIALWGWHTPVAYTAAFTHPAIYWLMQLSLLASFTWLWLGLLRSRAPLAAALVALLGAIQMGLLGALLVFAPSPLYLPHLLTTEAFGMSPLNDQQMAGVIMWVPANLPLMAVLIWRLLALVSPQAKPVPR